MPITLTLRQIRDAGPCGRKPAADGTLTGFCRLLDGLGENLIHPNLDRVIGIGDVLLINDLSDAQWCWRALSPRDRVSLCLPAVKRASVHTTDQRVHDCIIAIEQWLAGDDAVDLKAAADAAWAVEEAYLAEAAARVVEAADWEEARAAARAAAAAVWAAEASRTLAGSLERAAELSAQHDDIMRLSPPLWAKVKT